MIKSGEYILPTVYNGVKYRSRTEARWACFFVAAGINFTYEPEGFALDNGNYLPDFKLRAYNEVYAEVKGNAFTEREKEKCRQLCEATKSYVVMLDGAPDFKCYNVFIWGKDHYLDDSEQFKVREVQAILCTASCKHFPFYWGPGFTDETGYFKPEDWYKDHAQAIIKAKKERFNIYQ